MERQLIADLLMSVDLPTDFHYPPEFIRTVELGIVQLEPWLILTGDPLRQRFVGMRDRYPGKTYVHSPNGRTLATSPVGPGPPLK